LGRNELEEVKSMHDRPDRTEVYAKLIVGGPNAEVGWMAKLSTLARPLKTFRVGVGGLVRRWRMSRSV
jgi:hypothetical protein